MDVIGIVEGTIARYGAPELIRSDNEPEFIAYAILDWLVEQSIKTIYIKPGSPWENGHIESFHYKLRDECLNRELFASLAEARVILEGWRVEYNTFRPHSSLGYQTQGSSRRRASGLSSRPPGSFRGRLQSNQKPTHHHNPLPPNLLLLTCPTSGDRPLGHLKADFRLARCFLKGFKGDQINLMLAAAWNLRKWMRNVLFLWLRLFVGPYSTLNPVPAR